MQAYQIGSHTSRFAQIVSTLSQLQRCFRHIWIGSLTPQRPRQKKQGAKTHNNLVFVAVSYSYYRLRLRKYNNIINGKTNNS